MRCNPALCAGRQWTGPAFARKRLNVPPTRRPPRILTMPFVSLLPVWAIIIARFTSLLILKRSSRNGKQGTEIVRGANPPRAISVLLWAAMDPKDGQKNLVVRHLRCLW